MESIGDKRWRKKAEDRSVWAIVLNNNNNNNNKNKNIKYDSFSIPMIVHTLVKKCFYKRYVLMSFISGSLLLLCNLSFMYADCMVFGIQRDKDHIVSTHERQVAQQQ